MNHHDNHHYPTNTQPSDDHFEHQTAPHLHLAADFDSYAEAVDKWRWPIVDIQELKKLVDLNDNPHVIYSFTLGDEADPDIVVDFGERIRVWARSDNEHIQAELLDDEQAEAYDIYRSLTNQPDSAEAVEDFLDCYWGTFSSINEYVDNWPYDMEGAEVIQQLLWFKDRLEDDNTHVSLAEAALAFLLQHHTTFDLRDGKVTVFDAHNIKEDNE